MPSPDPLELEELVSNTWIRRFRLGSKRTSQDFDLRVEFYESQEMSEQPVVVDFLGVSQFRVDRMSGWLQVGPFVVDDQRGHHLERIRFSMRDGSEYHALSFSCLDYRLIASPDRVTPESAARDMLKAEIVRAVQSAFPGRAADLLIELDRVFED